MNLCQDLGKGRTVKDLDMQADDTEYSSFVPIPAVTSQKLFLFVKTPLILNLPHGVSVPR